MVIVMMVVVMGEVTWWWCMCKYVVSLCREMKVEAWCVYVCTCVHMCVSSVWGSDEGDVLCVCVHVCAFTPAWSPGSHHREAGATWSLAAHGTPAPHGKDF